MDNLSASNKRLEASVVDTNRSGGGRSAAGFRSDDYFFRL